MEPPPSVAVLSFAVHGKMKPASFKASCYKKSPTQRNGGQFTIRMPDPQVIIANLAINIMEINYKMPVAHA
ncbi:hypothetical protein FUT79_03260 [Treponema phagedenis]|nr:hypothetical protein FUT79_03260 [Treponema phagedenis]QEK07770.1 hypothetical protein FUT80_14325 [Treponema phagedenis]